MDNKGSLFGTLSGTTKEVLHQLTVNVPHKFVRGGQAALSQPNVSGLILAGTPGFITGLLNRTDMFDPRLKAKILKVADVTYGGEMGFDTAIELSSEFVYGELI
ncbi:eukaryotic peptide chain release factor subunit 1-1-like [Rutidosis leptorrhynchoides]|uniref:eukaryotic peptide chain release factor subunit 1-1-like n=1 Tax=Rutidosis leptorrhynchoides TaxID=125765 RepID=UPI003A98D495